MPQNQGELDATLLGEDKKEPRGVGGEAAEVSPEIRLRSG